MLLKWIISICVKPIKDFVGTKLNHFNFVRPSVVRHDAYCIARPLTPISRDAKYLYLVGGGGFNETCHKYSLCELALLKSFQGQRSKVKVICVCVCVNGVMAEAYNVASRLLYLFRPNATRMCHYSCHSLKYKFCKHSRFAVVLYCGAGYTVKTRCAVLCQHWLYWHYSQCWHSVVCDTWILNFVKSQIVCQDHKLMTLFLFYHVNDCML